ncbi:MAG: acyl-CoA dehydrogenase family protein [Deltaproteobacteria bacterium]|nr:acyl-CoA dehydrogenase family protein [Deltaproteobacteria bacterium]
MIQSSVREFVSKDIQPLIREAFQKDHFPREIVPGIAELGLLGSNLTGYGLPGMDNTSYGLVMKELERCDSGIRSFVSVQGALVMYPIHTFGSEEQKKKWLPALGKGEAIGCYGLTESEGGSDPGSMKTKAEKKAGGWVLNGSKMWITNGNIADVAVIWAKTEAGIRGFVVPTDAKGFKTQKMTGKLSLRASETAELYFDDVRLPEEALLPGTEGLKSALACLTQARYGIAWGAVGAAEACYDEACRFAQDRVLFGKTLASRQLVQRKLAIMLSRITQAQLLSLRLGQLKDEGQLHYAQVSMGKQNNCEMALEVSRACRDILGANGLLDEYVSMRHSCNLETVITYEGTNDIHLLILGQEITGVAAF